MRDKLKDREYFESYISELDEMVAMNKSNLDRGLIPEGRVNWVKMNTFNYQLNKAVAMYSSGYSLEEISEQLSSAISDFFADAWTDKTTKVHLKSGEYIDQYTIEPYGKMLRMLSMGYLLNLPEEIFSILIKKIDQDNICDDLFEFFISKRLNGRVTSCEENYDKEESVILKVYEKLRTSIQQGTSSEASKSVESFLKKDFNHKHSGFFNSHKSRANVYFGYWSFESAAIVAALGLDDSSFRDNEYYPKDLVDYFRSQNREEVT